MRPLSPSPDEVVIQGGADDRANHWNQPPRPFLDKLRASLGSDALNNARYQLVDHTFFEQVATEVHTGGTGGGNP